MTASIAAVQQKQQKNTVETQVDSLHVPSPIYASIRLIDGLIDIAEVDRENSLQYSSERLIRDPHESVTALLKNESRTRNIKYIAVEVRGAHTSRSLISHLWLKDDIVPYIVDPAHDDGTPVSESARKVASYFNEQNIVYVPIKPSNEVEIADLVSIDDYKASGSTHDIAMLQRLAKQYKGKRITFINATPQGGGVALMRHALIRLYRLMGVDAKWYVMIPKKEAFSITKTKFHNILQGVAPKGVTLTDEDKNIYNEWIKENAEKLRDVFKNSDVIVIDDPQPSGLIPYIKKINPHTKIIYRSHIQIVAGLASTEGTAQRVTWKFIWENAKHADVFVSHPIKGFVPQDVPKEKVVYMPATTDQLDGLNKPLTEKQMDYYMKLFNRLLIVQEGQTPLDKYRPFIVQIARFDPSKGIPDVIESYRKMRQMLHKKNATVIPQLVIAGNASIDDPDGVPVYNATMEILKMPQYKDIAADVKVARLPHIDQLLNTLLRRSSVVMQLSHKEGFEIKITEALLKGKPVLAYRTGGMPLQIEEGVNGYLVEVGHTDQVAEHLYDLFTNDELYSRMSVAAEKFANSDYLTLSNAVCWLYLAHQLSAGRRVHGYNAWVKELALADFEQASKVKKIFPFPVLSVLLSVMLKVPGMVTGTGK